MFPELTEAVQSLLKPRGLTSLDLKSGFGFDTLADVETAKRDRIRQMLGGGGPAWSGESVSESSALNHSVVNCCERIISESVGMLPLQLMQRKGDTKRAATHKNLYSVLHDEPNEQMSDMELREGVTGRCVLRGDGFARIHRRPVTGEAIALYPLSSVNVIQDNKRLIYEVPKGNGTDNETFVVESGKPHDIFHLRGHGFDGVRGLSVIAMARQSIGTALSAERYAAKFYAAGGRVPYVIEMANKFRTTQDFEAWRADWNEFYGNSDNWHTAPVMEPGMVYKQIGLGPEDAQFLETRQFNIPEICRWFRISPHMVGDLSRATFSNIEHLAIEFVKHTLMAWLVRWEKAIYRCVLTPEEKSHGYYAKHNVSALLRGDFQSRMAGYATVLQNGIANIDDVRELEDWDRLPNGSGQAHHIQLNMQTVPGTGEPTAAEKATLAKASQPTSGGATDGTGK